MTEDNYVQPLVEIEDAPEQPFFDAIRECIHTVPASKIRATAKTCLIVAEAMIEEAKEAMCAAFDSEALELKQHVASVEESLDGYKSDAEAWEKKATALLKGVQGLKSSISVMRAEADEDQKIKQDLEKELSEIRAAHARLIDENTKLWKDNAELHENNKGLKETRYRLATIIDDLAYVIRNS